MAEGNANSTIKKLDALINHIEENITGKITLEALSRLTGLSKFHLHKVFRILTDERLMDYVRNRKLAHSLGKLLDSKLKIIDIACEYGFEHEQTYIRAFKKAFRISPGKYRSEKPDLEITDVADLKRATPIGRDGFMLEPVIKIIPGFEAVGIGGTVQFIGGNGLHDSVFSTLTDRGNDFFYNRAREIKGAVHPCTCVTLLDFSPEGRINYAVCLEAPASAGIPGGMRRLAVPSNKYAVFKYAGLHHPRDLTEDFKEIYRYIHGVWLRESGYVMSESYSLEKSYNSREDFCEIDIAIPVKSRQG